MEDEMSDEQASEASLKEEKVEFQRVVAVASGWMSDFMFLTLCQSFKERKLEEFNKALSVFEAISQSSPLEGAASSEKTCICAFLSRVMHGKQLDVLFEEDEHIKPLMSAFKIWLNLDHIVADESLFEKITLLLLIQSVAVCLEAGQRSSASFTLKWLEEHHKLSHNLRLKLSTMVTQGDIYHPFLMSFSFSRLIETIQSFLDVYLEKNPSNFLWKAATKMVQSSRSFPFLEHVGSQDGSLSETDGSAQEDKKLKQKLFPTENTEVWKPNTTKNPVTKLSKSDLSRKRKLLPTKIEEWSPEIIQKPQVSLTRLSKAGSCFYLLSKYTCIISEIYLQVYKHELMLKGHFSPSEFCQMKAKKSLKSSEITENKGKNRKRPQKWTSQLDKFLIEGVKRHGQGNWSRILMDYDFEGRTGTMLKDRWRVLLKAHKVS